MYGENPFLNPISGENGRDLPLQWQRAYEDLSEMQDIQEHPLESHPSLLGVDPGLFCQHCEIRPKVQPELVHAERMKGLVFTFGKLASFNVLFPLRAYRKTYCLQINTYIVFASHRRWLDRQRLWGHGPSLKWNDCTLNMRLGKPIDLHLREGHHVKDTM